MPNNIQKNEGADFTSFGKKPQQSNAPQAKVSPIQEYHKVVRLTKRAKVLIFILVLLAAAQAALLFVVKKQNNTTLPDGYRLVTPPNQPAYIEPIK